MATPLDIGLIAKFDIIFPFLLIIILVYAFLSRMKWFEEKQGMAFLIAFLLAIMTLMSPIATRTINMMAPWFILLMIFAIFLLISYQALGVSEGTITEVVTKSHYSKTIVWWVIALALIIGIGSLATVVSQREGFISKLGQPTEETAPTEETGFWQTVVNPKVLGVALIFLIAMFTISRLAGTPPESLSPKEQPKKE
ncbi:hypothetical protein JW851_01520 [Candidatus Woesearchaeota archaeon]|nr:hypothetical protein [Candidatus Woesearchaeota archaeon]